MAAACVSSSLVQRMVLMAARTSVPVGAQHHRCLGAQHKVQRVGVGNALGGCVRM